MRAPTVIALLLSLSSAAYAQESSDRVKRPDEPPPRRLVGGGQPAVADTAMMTRPATPAAPKPAALQQLKDDFKNIQLANRGLADALSGKTDFNTRTIQTTASEIRDYAKRLKKNLALPQFRKDSEPQSEPKDEDLRATVGRLNKLVDSFVRNPMLSKGHVLDMEHAAKAGRDLEGIISVSGKLKKLAEKARLTASRND